MSERQPEIKTVALLMWGDLFEDFHDTIGVSLEHFRTAYTGTWLFGYVDALAAAGVRTVLVHVSERVEATERFMHVPSGTPVCILPAPRRHRLVRAIGRRLPRRKVASSVASYLSLPARRFIKELRQQGADAVLTQEYEHARFDLCVLLGRLARRPVFATFQGGIEPHSRLERPIRPFTIRACAGVVIASGVERERVRRAYRLPPDRIAAIPNAIDVAGYQPTERSTARRLLGIGDATRVAEWHGRVEVHRKGLDVLLDAWAILCNQRPLEELLLLLVGTGRDAAELRRRIDALGLDSIRWRDEYVAPPLPAPSSCSSADPSTCDCHTRSDTNPEPHVVQMTPSLDLGGFDAAELRHLADWDMWLRLLAHGLPATAPGIAVGYRLHPEAMSRSPEGILTELAIIDRRWRHLRGGRVLDPGPTHLWIAMSLLRGGQRAAAAASYLRAARTLPRAGLRGLLRTTHPRPPQPAHVIAGAPGGSPRRWGRPDVRAARRPDGGPEPAGPGAVMTEPFHVRSLLRSRPSEVAHWPSCGG